MQQEFKGAASPKVTDNREEFTLHDGDDLHKGGLTIMGTLEDTNECPIIQSPGCYQSESEQSNFSGCSGGQVPIESLDTAPCRLVGTTTTITTCDGGESNNLPWVDGLELDIKKSDSENNNMMASSSNQPRSLRTRSLSNRIFTDKVRYRRQTLQQMSRPLKRWLYRHKDKPYPSRAEKQSLAAGSNMTLTQVSNWFANVRRRLKNTVPCPDGSWSTRILQYNDYVEGNAELFSVYSDDGESDSDNSDNSDTVAATRNSTTFPIDSDLISDDDSPANEQGESGQSLGRDRHLSFSCPSLDDDNNASSSDPLDMIDQELMSHPKFKQTILQRYLNDTYNHAGFRVDAITANYIRQGSDSLCSRDYEEMSTTSSSPRVNGAHQTVFDETGGTDERKKMINCNKDILDKEVTAIIALTTMAQLKRKI